MFIPCLSWQIAVSFASKRSNQDEQPLLLAADDLLRSSWLQLQGHTPTLKQKHKMAVTPQELQDSIRTLVRKTPFCPPFMHKCIYIILPRQAWDKHRESTQKERRFLTAHGRRGRAGDARASAGRGGAAAGRGPDPGEENTRPLPLCGILVLLFLVLSDEKRR
jgi:hypothetical protein